MPGRDAFALEVLLVEDRLDGDVLTTGHGPEARTGDALAVFIVIARGVPVGGGDHAHVGLVEDSGRGLTIAHTRVVLGGNLPVHVDAHQNALAGRLGHCPSIFKGALPGDEAGHGPLLGGRRAPHLFAFKGALGIAGRLGLLRLLEHLGDNGRFGRLRLLGQDDRGRHQGRQQEGAR